MSKVADHIKLTVDESGTIDTATVTADVLTSVRVDVEGTLVEYQNEAVAKWTAEAQSSAVYHLIAEGSVVLKGVTVADKVVARNARILSEEYRLTLIEGSADVPRPQTDKERKTAVVEDMQASGASQDDIIAFLLG